MTLFPPSYAGRVANIVKTDANPTGNNIIIAGSSGTIAGSSLLLTNRWESVSVFADGSNYQITSMRKALPAQIISALGSGTYFPTPGIMKAKITIIGGGAAGGGAGTGASTGAAAAGGGGGGACIKWLAGSSLFASYPYIVGAGGPAGVSGNNAGLAGSSTIFGSSILSTALIAGTGVPGNGSAGASTATTNSGQQAGGTAIGGDINIVGGPSGAGIIFGAGNLTAGAGGGSYLASPSIAAAGTTTGGTSGNLYGGGGSGGSQVNNGGTQVGGVGAQGVIIIEEFV